MGFGFNKFTLSLALLVLGIFFIFYSVGQDLAQRNSTATLTPHGKIAIKNTLFLDDFFKDNLAQAALLAKEIANDIGKEDGYLIEKLRRFQLQGDFIEVYFGTEDGYFVSSDGSVFSGGDSSFDPRKRPWYLGSKKSPSYSEPYQTRTNGDVVLTFAAPIFKDGKFLGVFGLDVRLSDALREMSFKPSVQPDKAQLA